MLPSRFVLRLPRSVRLLPAVSRPACSAVYVSRSAQRLYATQTTENDPNLNGNYPEYPYVSNQKRDPYEKYDDQQLRRNFNDPLHEDDDVLNMWSPDIHDYVSNAKAGTYILAFFGIVAGSAYALSHVSPEKPAAPRVFQNGLFEEVGGAEYNKDVVSAKVDDGSYYQK
ncbi:hypothetical protein V1514DRAFT_333586 [Lipomyces japonicus]|uniref:uncharacterized protein n=1 Tax=Lipomyces japonicus TaxID=56871 RepID=UPI0034CEB6BE